MSAALKPWQDLTFIGIDLETTGKYPLDAEICEMAAVKWRGGVVVDRLQTLVKPTKPMGAEVIAIHNITNEMVETAPQIDSVLADFRSFIDDGILIAHHAPFDMGFLTVDFERLKLSLPTPAVLCSALLSRKALPKAPNHRLQTLISYLNLPQGAAHRALDDAQACLEVGLHCFKIIGEAATLNDLYKYQAVDLPWSRFSMEALSEMDNCRNLVTAIREKKSVQMVYQSGSRPGQAREIFPMGIVRNPDGDFLVGREVDETQSKRYFLSKVGKVLIQV